MGAAPAIQCVKCGQSNPVGATHCRACLGLISSEADATTTGINFTEPSSRPLGSGGAVPQVPVFPGVVIGGRYEIVESLGQGGMGAVFKCRDTELDRMVALKVIRPEYAGDAKTLQRFKQELILARQITHRNVVRIFDLGTHGDTKFITMELVEGRDLSKVLEDRRLSPVESARLIRQVCHALEAAHAENVIHRDLKPQNIMLDAAGKGLVMDFGLARSVEVSGLTRTGAVLGTPAYMSPEQAMGKPLDARSDLFSLGVIFYELLTGQQPYHADTIWAMLLKRTQEPAAPVASIVPEVPEALSQLVAKCLAIDPAERFQTATELALQLDLWLEDTPLSKVLTQPSRTPQQAAAAVPPPTETPNKKTARPKRWLAASSAVILLVSGMAAWRTFNGKPVAPAKPETVVVADIANRTGDAIFDGTLEPVLRLALEGAGFINAYNRTTLPARLESPTAAFDEQAAMRLAISQGLGVVVAGSLERRGSSYEITARVSRAVTGAEIGTASVTAGDKGEVLAAVGKLALNIRAALGDDTSEAAKRFTADSLTSTSLEAVHEYASAMNALSNGRFADARRHFSKATDLDPKFGLAWAGMASASRSLGENEDADKYIKLAYANIDSMTERERYRTRGLYFVLSGDQQKCVEEYSFLIARYPSDVGAHNNLGVCYSYLRNVPKATETMQKAADILPKRPVYRANLALYRAYAGAFDESEKNVRTVLELNPKYAKAYLTLAYAQLGMGRVQDAEKSYRTLATFNPRTASIAALGLADLAIYEGRFREAVEMLQAGAREDLAAKRPEAASDKLIALAYAQLSLGNKSATVSAVRQALTASDSVKTRFAGGRLLAAAGETAQAEKLAIGLASELKPEPKSYAKLLEAGIALAEGNGKKAVGLAAQGAEIFDTWIAHFDLGRSYLAAGAFAQADAEFDRCIKRRGEALELFMDDAATYGYFPAVYYHLGQAREGMNSSGGEPFKRYLDLRGNAAQDPLLAEIRQKALN